MSATAVGSTCSMALTGSVCDSLGQTRDKVSVESTKERSSTLAIATLSTEPVSHLSGEHGRSQPTIFAFTDPPVGADDPLPIPPYLNYIPPGLQCELMNVGTRLQPVVCAASRFSVGHVWGPYGAHMSQELCKALRVVDNQSIAELNIVVKNTNSVVDEKTILLGEEHTWIQILYERGMQVNHQEFNVELLLDYVSKTLTVVVTKEIWRTDSLQGVLRVHSVPLMLKAPSFTTTGPVITVCNDVKPGTKPMLISSGGPGSPRRDKKCAFCGIPFSSPDTLAAHMTHYCSKRPNVPCMPGPCTNIVQSATNEALPRVEAHRTPNNKRPRNPTTNICNTIGSDVAPSTSFPFPISSFAKSLDSQTQLSNHPNNLPLNMLHTALSSALIGSSAQPHGHMANPVLGSNSSMIPGPSHATTNHLAPEPPVLPRTAEPPRANRMIQDSPTYGGHPRGDAHTGHRFNPALYGNDPYVMQDAAILPAFCAGCQQFFSSNYFYQCHLDMSCRVFTNLADKYSKSAKLSAYDGRSVQDVDWADCLSLLEATAKLGLVLAAPLITPTGSAFVPVHPFCGLLKMRNQDKPMCAFVEAPSFVDKTGPGTNMRNANVLDLSRPSDANSTYQRTPGHPGTFANPGPAGGHVVQDSEPTRGVPQQRDASHLQSSMREIMSHSSMKSSDNVSNTSSSTDTRQDNSNLAELIVKACLQNLSSNEQTVPTTTGPNSSANAYPDTAGPSASQPQPSTEVAGPQPSDLPSNIQSNYGELLTLLAAAMNPSNQTRATNLTVDKAVSPHHSPQSTQDAQDRPYLCTYCQTRFYAYVTFQAHQQYYCQGRRDLLQEDNSPTATSLPNSRPTSPASPSTSKRRRVLTSSPSSTIDHSSGSKTGSTLPPNGFSSNASSTSGSGDEVDPGHSKRSDNRDTSIWEPCGNNELRCTACGYVGQTPRGMKMHQRLHGCRGPNPSNDTPPKGKNRRQEEQPGPSHRPGDSRTNLDISPFFKF